MGRSGNGPRLNPSEEGERETLELAFGAIAERDRRRLRALLDPKARVLTARTIHVGAEAVVEWALKRFDHLDRRYVLERATPAGRGWLGRARVEYVWRESGEVGDASPIWLGLVLGPAGIRELSLHDDEGSARAALG